MLNFLELFLEPELGRTHRLLSHGSVLVRQTGRRRLEGGGAPPLPGGEGTGAPRPGCGGAPRRGWRCATTGDEAGEEVHRGWG